MALLEDWGELESLLLGVPDHTDEVLGDVVHSLYDRDREALKRLQA